MFWGGSSGGGSIPSISVGNGQTFYQPDEGFADVRGQSHHSMQSLVQGHGTGAMLMDNTPPHVSNMMGMGSLDARSQVAMSYPGQVLETSYHQELPRWLNYGGN